MAVDVTTGLQKTLKMIGKMNVSQSRFKLVHVVDEQHPAPVGMTRLLCHKIFMFTKSTDAGFLSIKSSSMNFIVTVSLHHR